MPSKEELIKWMTEKRENLPFESKVGLIWEFWENKDTIPDLRRDKERLEKEKEHWEKEAGFWKAAYARESENNLNLQEQINDYLEEIEEKSQWLLVAKDRVLQLDKTLEASRNILQHQLDYLKNLTARLEKEQAKNIDNQAYQTHVQEDLKRLAGERKDLTKALQDLAEQEQRNKELRDKEIKELNSQIAELKKQYETKLKELEQHSAELKKQRDNRPNITLDEWNATNQQLAEKEQELIKEKSWWDKWINSDISLFSSSLNRSINIYSVTQQQFGYIGFVSPNTGNKLLFNFEIGKYFSSDNDFKAEFNTNSYRKFNSNNDDKELKEWIRDNIYQYYRDKE